MPRVKYALELLRLLENEVADLTGTAEDIQDVRSLITDIKAALLDTKTKD